MITENKLCNQNIRNLQVIRCATFYSFDIIGPENEKQTAVVNAFRHAWKGYKTYAWGRDQLKPISKSHQVCIEFDCNTNKTYSK